MRNKALTLTYVFIFVIFGLLGYWNPLVGDDLNWWSSWGTNYFFSGTFLTYDGRYLGDLLVILMTHFKIISFLIYGMSAVAISYLIMKIAQSLFNNYHPILTLMLTAILLLTPPKDIYRQIWGWHAGFANYVPSVIFPLFFIYIISKYYNNFAATINISKFSKSLLLITAILSQFLAEHITLLNCCNDLIILLFLHRHFSSDFFHKYFRWLGLGHLVGAILMFINGAYLKILWQGHDSYRSLDSQQAMLLPYLKTFFSNKKIILLIVFIIIGFVLNFRKKPDSKFLTINALLLVDALVAIVPFFVINPFGPRCIFASYVFLATLLITNWIAWLQNYFKVFTVISLALFMMLGIHFDKIALNYWQINELSKQYCNYQQTTANSKIYIINYPNTDYLWAPNMSEDSIFQSFFVHQKDKPIIGIEYDKWKQHTSKLKVNDLAKFDRQIKITN